MGIVTPSPCESNLGFISTTPEYRYIPRRRTE